MSSFIFLHQSSSLSLCTVFDYISSNIDEVLLINPSAVFDFGGLTPIIRTGLPILVELIDLMNSVIISNDITQMVTFPTQTPDSDSHSPALLDLFIS